MISFVIIDSLTSIVEGSIPPIPYKQIWTIRYTSILAEDPVMDASQRHCLVSTTTWRVSKRGGWESLSDSKPFPQLQSQSLAYMRGVGEIRFKVVDGDG